MVNQKLWSRIDVRFVGLFFLVVFIIPQMILWSLLWKSPNAYEFWVNFSVLELPIVSIAQITQLVTYASVHLSVAHFGSNLLFLGLVSFWFLKQYSGGRLVAIYILGVIFPALCLAIFSGWSQTPIQIGGASAAIYTLFFYYYIRNENDTFSSFKIKIKYLLLLFIAKDIWVLLDTSGFSATVAIHFCGATIGCLLGFIDKKRTLNTTVSVEETAKPESPIVTDTKEIQKIIKQVQTSGYESLTEQQKKIIEQNNQS